MAEYTGEYCYHIDVQACMVEYTGEYCIVLVYRLVWLSILENTVIILVHRLVWLSILENTVIILVYRLVWLSILENTIVVLTWAWLLWLTGTGCNRLPTQSPIVSPAPSCCPERDRVIYSDNILQDPTSGITLVRNCMRAQNI